MFIPPVERYEPLAHERRTTDPPVKRPSLSSSTPSVAAERTAPGGPTNTAYRWPRRASWPLTPEVAPPITDAAARHAHLVAQGYDEAPRRRAAGRPLPARGRAPAGCPARFPSTNAPRGSCVASSSAHTRPPTRHPGQSMRSERLELDPTPAPAALDTARTPSAPPHSAPAPHRAGRAATAPAPPRRPKRICTSSPLGTCTTAPWVNRAWISRPATAIVSATAGPPHSWVSPSPMLRPDKPPRRASGLTPGSQPQQRVDHAIVSRPDDSGAASRSGSSSGRSRVSGSSFVAVYQTWARRGPRAGGGATARGPGASVRKTDCTDRRSGIRHRRHDNWYRRAQGPSHGSHGPSTTHCRRAAA